MHQRTQDLPVSMEAPGMKVHNDSWGGMVVGYFELPAGTDFTPMLEGLANDACHCPHWGYVLKGAIHLKYNDGSVEVSKAGEVFYWPAGHTAWVEEDCIFMDFSPEKEFNEVIAHVTKKMEQSA